MFQVMFTFLIFLTLFIIFPLLFGASQPAQPTTASNTVVLAAATCTSPYIVQAGDTMYSIAQKCSVSYDSLLAANSSVTDPNQIYPGQSIIIPQGGSIPNTGGQTYTVVAGDTLSEIAVQFNTTVQAILAVNPWITNPDLIYPGDVITLPSGSSPGIPPTGAITYTVVPGDTLYSIAQRYNTTVSAILTANPWITNPNLIYPGWVIVIP